MPSLSFMIDRLDSRPVWVWLARRFQARTGRAFLPNGEDGSQTFARVGSAPRVCRVALQEQLLELQGPHGRILPHGSGHELTGTGHAALLLPQACIHRRVSLSVDAPAGCAHNRH